MLARLGIIFVTLGGLTGLVGCQTASALLSGAKPTASIRGVWLDQLGPQGLTLLFDVEVTNPYSIPLPVTRLDYALATGEAAFLAGSAPSQGAIPAKKSKTLQLPAAVNFASLLATVSKLRPGAVVPYTASLDLVVDAPQLGELKLPVKKSGEFPIPAAPDVQLASVTWEKLAWDEAKAVFSLRVKNTNDFPVDLARMNYDLSLGGTKVASSKLAKSMMLRKGDTGDITVPLSLSPMKLGMGLFNILRGEGSSYEIVGDLNLGTPFGKLDMPFTRKGQTVFTSSN